MEYDEFSAMSTTLQVAAEGNRSDLQPGFERVREFVAESEERFSRFRESSELTSLNRSAGGWFYASPELFELVKEALDLHALTDGLFDPSILNALRRAGYDRSIDEIRRAGALPASTDFERVSLPFSETRLDPDNRAVLLPSGVQIDLGGIAKGWIASHAAELMLEFSDACAVSAGGDMALFGLPSEGRGWEVSLEDPRDVERTIAVLRVPPGGLTTSAVTRRRWFQGGQSRHHIIDPCTGEPSISPWLSVTVYAKSVILAEVFAKALLIAGPGGAQSLASRVDGLKYVAIDREGEVFSTLENLELIDVLEPIL